MTTKRAHRVAMAAVTVALFGASHAGAEDSVLRCRLSECITQAIATHPALEASSARVARAQAIVGERKAERRPELGIVTGFGYLAGEPISPFAALNDRYPGDRGRLNGAFYDALIRLTVPVLSEGRWLGSASHAERAAELLESQEEQARSALRRTVAEEVARAYFEMLEARSAVPLFEAIVTARESAAQEARLQLEQRLLSRDEASLAEVQLATARGDLEAAHLSLEVAGRRLARAIGFPTGRAEALEPDPGDTPGAGPSALDPERWPGMQAARLALEAQKAEVQRLSTDRAPSVELLARFGVADNLSPPVRDQTYVGIRVTIPLLDSGLAKRKVARATAELAEKEADLKRLRLALATRLDEIQTRRRSLDFAAPVLEARLEEARGALETKQVLETEGLAPPSETAEARVAQLQLELERGRWAYQRALLEALLRVASGEWDETSTDRPGQ